MHQMEFILRMCMCSSVQNNIVDEFHSLDILNRVHWSPSKDSISI